MRRQRDLCEALDGRHLTLVDDHWGRGMTRVVLDWRKNKLGARPAACRLCGVKTLLRDENGKPCHKICAEQDIERRAAAAARRP